MTNYIPAKDRPETLKDLETALDAIKNKIKENYIDAGKILVVIRDQRLWKVSGYHSFDDYLVKRWSIHSRRAYQLIEASEVMMTLSQNDCTMVQNERVARELSKAPEEERPRVIAAVVERGEMVTTKSIKAEVAKLPPAAKNGEHKPAIPLDATGYPLTKTATIYWKRRGEIQAVLDGISEIKSLLERVGEERDVLWEGLNHNGCDAMLSSLYRYVSEAKPYAVCPQCGGHPEIQPTKCPRCRGKAMISKLQFETGTSDKIKELRDAHAKSILSK